MSDELLACPIPWCGAPARKTSAHFVCCTGRYCALRDADIPLEEWNTRAPAGLMAWARAIQPHLEQLLQDNAEVFGIEGDGESCWPLLAEFVTKLRVLLPPSQPPSRASGVGDEEADARRGSERPEWATSPFDA